MRFTLKLKEDGRYVSKAVYTILGLNCSGQKELLGLYISESEGVKYWLSILMDLHNRSVQDILITCTDGLNGFPEAIESIFPRTEVTNYASSIKFATVCVILPVKFKKNL